MKLATILLLVGVAILAYAMSIAPYKDETLFMERYMALSAGQSAEYWKLRDEMLTPKFQLQDFGGTLVAVSFGVFLVSRKGWRNLKSPKSRATLFLLAFAAPSLTAGAYVFDLLQGFARGEFPHWADSMSIPLMGMPVLLIVLLAWSGAHLAFLRGTYQRVFLSQAVSRKANWWLLAVATITAALVALCASVGQYWYAVPGAVWLYFYISLAASRCSTHAAEPIIPPGAAR
jgi:hypothetical protein